LIIVIVIDQPLLLLPITLPTARVALLLRTALDCALPDLPTRLTRRALVHRLDHLHSMNVRLRSGLDEAGFGDHRNDHFEQQEEHVLLSEHTVSHHADDLDHSEQVDLPLAEDLLAQYVGDCEDARASDARAAVNEHRRGCKLSVCGMMRLRASTEWMADTSTLTSNCWSGSHPITEITLSTRDVTLLCS
ncbi:hypothetical protein PENTCL1PPCAC_1642, partial [Pristionchus entomophagus]